MSNMSMSAPPSVTMEDSVITQEIVGGGDDCRCQVNVALPCDSDNNFCRAGHCCYDAGCRKPKPIVQLYCCLCKKDKCKIVTGCPLEKDKNFCRVRCCCYDAGCTKFRIRCQYLCCQVGDWTSKNAVGVAVDLDVSHDSGSFSD
mmetsp:Transcript_17788/g.25006  ORF Transcript_17788/g.25006 Transcript_17788/m.25006 type:complete len:144 (+) Transcript_17788:34-465(+)